MMQRWAVQWYSRNKLDGETRYWVGDGTNPVLFPTRALALTYIGAHYGYIAKRPDLRSEPHGWRMPRPIKVEVILKPVYAVTKS